MFIRPPLPQPLANSSVPFALVLRSGGTQRVIEIGGRITTALILLACLLIAWFIAGVSYVAFRDDALRMVAFGERRSVQAYEDRIADLRQRIDRMTARQVANQDTIEDRVAGLIARQAELEARQVMVAEINQRARDSGMPTAGLAGFEARDAAVSAAKPLPSTFQPTPVMPGRPTPLDGIPALPFAAEPPATKPAPAPRSFDELKMRGTIQTIVEEIERRTERLERSQIGVLQEVAGRAEIQAIRDRRVIAAAGLPLSRFGLTALQARAPLAASQEIATAMPLRDVAESTPMGGPLLPPRAPSLAEAFETGFSAAEQNLRAASATRRAIRALPLARPLGQQHDITSGFGTRVDPFTRGYAMHSGIDFRAPTGAHVRVTAPGRVIEAGTNGGYGRMVEVDHGHGISTRYAHLSTILVKEGDVVAKGAIIGQVGSTGRSTGPHLHYEVRIDEDATDPMRFLRAMREQH